MMKKEVTNFLNKSSQLLEEPVAYAKPKWNQLKVGVDLGTSSIVLVVLNEKNQPLVCLSEEAHVVRDGIVVNFFEAVQIVKRLKTTAEDLLSTQLLVASGAIPPGTGGSCQKAVLHVIEAAEMDCDQVVDEPYAAAAVLAIEEGAVVDIGGGTTGISIFKEGKAVYSADEATGGHHMTLVLAGYYHTDMEVSESIKRDPQRYDETFQIIQPVTEKMAAITARFIEESKEEVKKVYIVGGASMFPQFPAVFQDTVGRPTTQPVHPRLVTPLGIAKLSRAF